MSIHQEHLGEEGLKTNSREKVMDYKGGPSPQYTYFEGAWGRIGDKGPNVVEGRIQAVSKWSTRGCVRANTNGGERRGKIGWKRWREEWQTRFS